VNYRNTVFEDIHDIISYSDLYEQLSGVRLPF
jgi:hypothetical protein